MSDQPPLAAAPVGMAVMLAAVGALFVGAPACVADALPGCSPELLSRVIGG